MNAPRGKTFLLSSPESGALHLPERSSTPARHKGGTTIPSSLLTFTFDVWIAERTGPQKLSTMLQPQSCGFISAFEHGMLLRGRFWGHGTTADHVRRRVFDRTLFKALFKSRDLLKRDLSMSVGTFILVWVTLAQSKSNLILLKTEYCTHQGHVKCF